MKTKSAKFLLAFVAITIPLIATNVWFSVAPSSANHNESYYVEAEGYASGGWGDVTLYKNYSAVGSGSGGWGIYAGTWQSDSGPQSIEYYAEVYDWYYGQYQSAWHWVTINGPANLAPYVACDYTHANVPQGTNLHGSGWAADNEMGAPVSRVDILINGNDVGDATLGADRQDVADAYGRSDFKYSGWNFDWNTSSLGVGTHSVEFVAWDNQGGSSTFGYRTFNVTSAGPSITLLSPSAQTVSLGTTLSISSYATDPTGDITHHHLDIQRPDGSWNWEGGFATGEPFMGGPVGSGASSTRTASFTFNQLGTWYVRSWVNDAASNNQHSATVAVTVVDNSAPSVPAGLSHSAITPSSFTLSWAPSSDNVGVTGYEVYKDGVYYGSTSTATSLSITGLAYNTTYGMKVRARDAAGNWSALQVNPYNVTTTYILAAPATLNAVSMGSSFATFSWSPGSASSGVKEYKIYRDNVHVATTTGTHFTDWNSKPGAVYKVRTVDNLNQNSGDSSTLTNGSTASFVVFTPLT